MGEKAFAAFLAKAMLKVIALGAAWGGAEHEAFVTTDGAVKKLLPFHIGAVLCRQRLEVAQQQPAEFPAVAQPKILPQMIGPQATARDHVGKPTLEFRAVRRIPAQ